jgi:hypothetical protein
VLEPVADRFRLCQNGVAAKNHTLQKEPAFGASQGWFFYGRGIQHSA